MYSLQASTDQDATSSPPTFSPSDSLANSTNNIMPTAASGAYIANSNGKRPHGALTNGGEEDEVENMPNAGSNKPVKTHNASGYRWARAEDEPGYSWSNKKAFDEMNKAWDNLVHKDAMVKGRFGDPLEIAEKESVLLESIKG
ncbi:hypothetical protein Q7P37_001163 [Cladosporium fusiforme]